MISPSLFVNVQFFLDDFLRHQNSLSLSLTEDIYHKNKKDKLNESASKNQKKNQNLWHEQTSIKHRIQQKEFNRIERKN